MSDVLGRLFGRLLALVIMAVGVTGVVWPWIQWLGRLDNPRRGLDFSSMMDLPTFMQYWLTATASHWCAIALGAILYHLVSQPRANADFDVD